MNPVEGQTETQRARSRIAVLPFVNMSADPENEYFSDGLTEELINRLACNPELQVVSRTSAFRYKGQNEDLRKVGEQLNVETVLEGSVRTSGDQIRVTAQLIDVGTGYHLFSRRYQREFKDIFELQDELAVAVVREISPWSTGQPQATLTRTENMEAYGAYLRGMHAMANRFHDLSHCLDCFREALEQDPQYAPAWAGLAQGYFMLAWFYMDQENPTLPLARQAAEKTLAADPDSALGLSSLAVVECSMDWGWAAAERRFRRALELQPNLAIAYMDYAFACLIPQLRMDEACSLIEKGLSLDPFNPLMQACAIFIYGNSLRYDDALRRYDLAQTIAPNYGPINVAMGLAHEWNGHPERAIAEYRIGCELTGHVPFPVSCLGHALAASGAKAEAEDILERLLQAPVQHAPDIARVYSGFRNKDETLRWLERGADERSLYLLRVTGDPRFDWLEPEPRYRAFLTSMGLPVSR
jgi:TolB-like protein